MSLWVDPMVVYLALVILFLVVARSPSLHTRAGGMILAAALVTVIAGMVLDPRLGTRLSDPRRLPAAVFVVAAMVVSWWALRRESLRRREGRRRPPRVGRSTDIVGVLGVVAVTVLAILRPVVDDTEPLPLPWFLMGLRELTAVFPPSLAFGVLPAVLLIALFAAPWLDTREPGQLDARRDEVPFFLFAWAAIGWAPMAAGVFWRPSPPELPPSLSVRVFEDLLAVPQPSWLLLRELPGLLLVGLLFAGLPSWLSRWRASRGVFARHRRRLGPMRYYVVMLLGVLVAWVPLRVAVAWLFGVGAWIDLAEWGLVV